MTAKVSPLLLLAQKGQLPLCSFRPSRNTVTGESKFQPWIDSGAAIRTLFGGNRVGKTQTSGFVFVCMCLGESLKPYIAYMHPEVQDFVSRCIMEGSKDGWAASVSYGLQASGNQEKILEYLPEEQIKSRAWQSKPQNILAQLTLHNGRKITFKSYEQGREDFQAAGVGVVWCDEEPPKDIWQEIGLRQKAGQPLRRILSMTPVMGMTWVYSDLYLSGSTDVFTVTAGWDDNEWLTSEQKRQMAIGLSDDEIAMRRDGSFVKRTGLVYKDFNQARNTVDADFEPEPGRHSIYRSMDFGFAEDHPFVCLWFAIDTDGTATIYDELYLRQTAMDRTTELVLERTQPYKPRGSWGDSARPDWIDYLSRNGIPTQKAVKDVELGITKVTEWLLPNPVTGLPRLRISKRCTELIRQLESYSYPGKVREADRGKRIPEKKDDDGPDALRYGVVSYTKGLLKSSEAIVFERGDSVTGYGGRIGRTKSEDAPRGYVSPTAKAWRPYSS